LQSSNSQGPRSWHHSEVRAHPSHVRLAMLIRSLPTVRQLYSRGQTCRACASGPFMTQIGHRWQTQLTSPALAPDLTRPIRGDSVQDLQAHQPKGFPYTHPPDQISQATINPRPPCPITRFPTPKHFETSAMPTQDGLRLNHLHRTKKVRPEPGHPYEQRAITAKQSKTRRCPPHSDRELMAEKQILGLKPAPRLE
jgi:hypothetical protein